VLGFGFPFNVNKSPSFSVHYVSLIHVESGHIRIARVGKYCVKQQSIKREKLRESYSHFYKTSYSKTSITDSLTVGFRSNLEGRFAALETIFSPLRSSKRFLSREISYSEGIRFFEDFSYSCSWFVSFRGGPSPCAT
jgi:hypothetical protein